MPENTNIENQPLELHKAHDTNNKNAALTVILIHGISADSSSFTHAIEYFEKDPALKAVRFIAFDLLGAGKSFTSDQLNYDFSDQLTALDNSIKKLNLTTPVVLIGHSMGTFIATRYAKEHKHLVKALILVSPPIYTPADLKNPAFQVALDGFRKVVGQKNHAVLETKAFNNELKLIVSNPKNYQVLVDTTIPTTLVYGELDEIIASNNIPKLLKENPHITTIKTPDTHRVSREKYTKIAKILEELIDA